MLRGRPAFNRLIYAFRTVLTDTVTWLFHDLRDPSLTTADTPVKPFHPVLRPLSRHTLSLPKALVPLDIPALDGEEVLELLGLHMLASPLSSAEPAAATG